MRLLIKAKFWIKVLLFTVLNFLLCLIFGVLFRSGTVQEHIDSIREKDLWNYFFLSIGFALAFSLWFYNDPESKNSRSDRS